MGEKREMDDEFARQLRIETQEKTTTWNRNQMNIELGYFS